MKVTVLGAGKMGGALVKGMIAAGLASAAEITGVARSEESRQKFLALSPGLGWSAEPELAVKGAEVIILAVKPVQIQEMAGQIKESAEKALIISVAAGIRLESLKAILGEEAKLVRAMPNTPVVLREGVTAFAAAGSVSVEEKAWVKKLFASLGKAYEVEEDQIDAVTALSGSGPAYFYLFASCLEKAGIAQGLNPELAREMAGQTALGAARMMMAGSADPEELIAQVKSKGGTTEAALNVFAGRDLAGVVGEAVSAAVNRSKELSGKK